MGSLIFIPIITLNLVLGVFNLLPINSLDGFKIVSGFLSDKKAGEWYDLERYGYIFLLLLIIPLGSSSMLDILIGPAFYFMMKLFLPASLGKII